MRTRDIRLTDKRAKLHVKSKRLAKLFYLYRGYQFDALTCFVYNVGASNFAGSTLLRLLNQGDYDGAAGQFLLWNEITAGGIKKPSLGLTNRRRSEQNLFLDGKYQ